MGRIIPPSGGGSATWARDIVRTFDLGMRAGSGTAVLNRAWFMRCSGAATISKIGLQVATASGNINVGIFRNSGSGRNAVPGTMLTSSGSVACPATGYAEVTLGATVSVTDGDWFALVADNGTATFAVAANGAVDTNLAAGRMYRKDSSFTLISDPASLQPCTGPCWMLVGVP